MSTPPRPLAILAAVQLSEVTDEDQQASLDELERLVTTLGADVVERVIQKRAAPAAGTVFGKGKIDELAEKLRMHGATQVVFDQELSPNQLRNLEKELDAGVLDRAGVIIEIFHRHAKTREARLQIEMARLKYQAPRLRVTGEKERLSGKGAGESALELDRRRLRDRIAELGRELERLHADSEGRRSRRKDQARVALVGYTNAGKSSLMRALTGSGVLVADKLFATLDTTVRSMHPEVFPKVLVSDTVGFIKKLPHDLVASFRSTLDEAHEASLLIFVVDASDPTFRSQLEVTQTVLAEIEADSIPSFLVLNKADRVDAPTAERLKREFRGAAFVSARNPADVETVRSRIYSFFEKGMEEAEILVPYAKASLLGEIRLTARVLEESFTEEGTKFKIRTYPETVKRLKAALAATTPTEPDPIP